MNSRIFGFILKGVEKFLSRIVIVRRAYGEQVLDKGFRQAGYRSELTTFVILGDDAKANKKKIKNAANKLSRECKRQVKKDISNDADKMVVEDSEDE